MRKLPAAILCIFILALQTNAQTVKKEEYVINGTIKGINSGIVRMLAKNSIALDSATDSAEIVNGKFVFRGKVGAPEDRGFMIIPGNWSFRAFLENAPLTLEIDTADAQHQYVKNIDYPMIWTIKQTGSEFADAYNKYQNETGQTYFISLLKSLKTTTKSSNVAVIQSKMDSARKNMAANQKLWLENYIQKYPASVAGVFILHEFYQQTTPPQSYLQAMLSKFTGAAKASVYYKQLNEVAINLNNTQVNGQAPDVTLQKRDKTTFTLSATRGKITLIDFWASWCAPCRAAIPGWKKAYNKYRNKGFTIVSVSEDSEWSKWTKAIDKEQMPWMQVIDEYSAKSSGGKASNLFPHNTIPFYVLLDKEGKVILASGHDSEIAKKIDEVLR